MKTIAVNLKNRSYPIIVGRGVIESLGKLLRKASIGKDAYVITNPGIKRKFASKLERSLLSAGFSVRFKVVPDTEKSKSLGTCAAILKDLAAYDVKRKIFIVALGGGVIGDLSGFVASLYRRGIPYVQVPTTLLAQVDSSIGGKTAVDLAQAKNLVGAFYQPRLVASDTNALSSLDPRQLRSGLAEVIKYGIIKDNQLFSFLEKKHRDVLSLKPASLEYIIERSSRIKADIVGRDEREEKGLRTILNFGHTVGHALEAASGYTRLAHGEAIALGMLAAADISKKMNLLSEADHKRITRLISAVGLPTTISRISLKSVINAHYRDKKFIGAKNRFVLVQGIGKVRVVENVPLAFITASIAKLIR